MNDVINKMQKDSIILITGAGGLLGRATQKVLDGAGYTRVLTPTRQQLNLSSKESTEQYFSDHNPTVVIHLASMVFGLGGNLKNQFSSALENTLINQNLFSIASQNQIERIFFAGTVASYPYPYISLPLKEEDFFYGLPHYGEFGYAMAKRHAYTFLEILSKEKSIKYAYGIFTNLYGENDRFNIESGHVVPSLIAKTYEASISNSPLSVWGNGTAERDFLHIDDAARGLLKCLESADNTMINISSGSGVSIGKIARTLGNLAGIKEIIFDSEKPVGIQSRIVDNSRLKALGFSPEVSIESGLEKVYNWYSSNIKNIRK